MKEQNSYNIKLTGLSIGYEQSGGIPLEILKNVNLSAAPGEMVALIGSNGIGKSTLLRTIGGFQPWFDGEIYISNKNLCSLSAKEIARLMSFVSTENIHVPNLSVFDLVAFGRFPYTNWIGMLSETDKAVINEAIEKVGLSGFRERSILQISDGERQRALIARALAQDTPLIILDEPTAYLDVSNKYEIFHLLQMLALEKKKTIVLSTHDLNIALREVDKLWIISENSIYQGAPEDAVLQGWLSNLFLNKHIGFDVDEGEFFFKKKFRAKVNVKGEGLSLIWTLRALNRKGYQIVMQAEHDFSIVAEENSWTLTSGKSVRKFQSIYQLITFLESIA